MEKLQNNNFDEKIAKGIVLVDFYADWCGPCKMLSSVLEELKESYPQVHFYQVNVDEERALAKQYGVMSIPCVLLFKEGSLVSTTMGYSPKPMMENFLQRALSK